MPRAVHAGLALAAAAFVIDVLVHLAPAPHHHGEFRVEEHLAHLVGLVAMAVVLVGVVADGLRRQRSHRRQGRRPEGGSRHAHR